MAVRKLCDVHEPPSPELVRQLTELRLCRPIDLHRARGRVRSLSHDLPAFDSVWIDSLVQLRLLTPYQARLLEQGRAEQLRIGQYVVIDELGHGRGRTTFIAQQVSRRERRVLKCYQIGIHRIDEVSRNMATMIGRAKEFAHPHVVLPGEFMASEEGGLVTVSRFVPGLPLNELLVRRGRFPAAVVFEIGRQLLDGLAALHSKSLIHGDIRMSNVRLTDNGLAVLVDGVSRLAIHPEITIHDTMALEAYDGIAPELIGTGEPPTASSELYSIGCLLWQLLAGRSPFPSADRLAKLASHQTKSIEDVRIWAPDTPALLAQTICQLTSPKTTDRPRSCAEVLQRWGKPNSNGRSRLKQFRRLFEGDVPHFARPAIESAIPGKSVWLAALIFSATGIAAVLFSAGLRSELLEITQKAKDFLTIKRNNFTESSGQSATKASLVQPTEKTKYGGLRPLPESENGVILLKEFGPFEAPRQIVEKNKLTIQSVAGIKAEIHVDSDPLSLHAVSVSIDGVTIRRVGENDPGSLLRVRSQSLNVSNCEFVSHSTTGTRDAAATEIVSMSWRPLNTMSSETHSVSVVNTAFYGVGPAMLLKQLPRKLQATNTLKVGLAAFVALDPKCLAADFSIELNRVTLRQSGPLLFLAGEPAMRIGSSPIRIQSTDSVFQLAEPKSGLIVIVADTPRTDISNCIAMNVSNSVVAHETTLVSRYDSTSNIASIVREDDIEDQFDGLSMVGIHFSGAELHNWSHSATRSIDGPQGAAEALPGIETKR